MNKIACTACEKVAQTAETKWWLILTTVRSGPVDPSHGTFCSDDCVLEYLSRRRSVLIDTTQLIVAGRSETAAFQRRRTVNVRLLKEVASLYLADDKGAPTQAVATGLATSHRNAARYVALARQSGLLPPYGSDIEAFVAGGAA